MRNVNFFSVFSFPYYWSVPLGFPLAVGLSSVCSITNLMSTLRFDLSTAIPILGFFSAGQPMTTSLHLSLGFSQEVESFHDKVHDPLCPCCLLPL